MRWIVRHRQRGAVRRVATIVVASAVLVGVGVSGATSTATGAPAECSLATANQLALERKLNSFLLDDPVKQALCGPFTGPGSNAMALTLNAPTCWSPQGWAVFTFAGGDWQLVLDQPLQFLAGPLVANGGDIRETQPVARAGDPRCIPSGGTRARVWHWDGTRLVAGPFKQVTPGVVRPKQAVVFGRSPLRVSCEMRDDGSDSGSYVYCWVGLGRSGTPHVRMGPSGRIDKVVRQALPTGLGGPTLPYGKHVSTGRFRCESRRSGLRCTVARTGKGFVFNNSGAKRVGP
jgi:hypothetical protein